MDSKVLLADFLDFKKSKSDLIQFFGEDLLNAAGPSLQVTTKDVIAAIDRYLRNEISKDQLLDWVNVLWFTDLFEYNDNEADSIASVMTVLETLDEADVSLTERDYLKMKECLYHNREYTEQCK